MGNIFDDVKLTWRETEYRISASRVLGAIARIEDSVTLPELARATQRAAPPMAKVAQAFASVLRYAGARVTDEEVYSGMFANEEVAEAVASAVTTLMQMMLPPSAKNRLALDHLAPDDEPQPGNFQPATVEAS